MSQRDGSASLFAALSLWCIGLLVLLGAWSFAWSFRDGWGGPDYMIESRGFLALGRFWANFQRPFLSLVMPCFVAGCLLYWRDRKRAA